MDAIKKRVLKPRDQCGDHEERRKKKKRKEETTRTMRPFAPSTNSLRFFVEWNLQQEETVRGVRGAVLRGGGRGDGKGGVGGSEGGSRSVPCGT